MKMIAFTPHGYWQSRRNRYDTFVTVMGLVWAITNYTLAVSIFLLSRLQMPATYLFMFSPFLCIERFVALFWLRRHYFALFYNHRQTRYTENAYVNRRRIGVQVFFHYHG